MNVFFQIDKLYHDIKLILHEKDAHRAFSLTKYAWINLSDVYISCSPCE